MERLEAKQISGRTYYYYSKMGMDRWQVSTSLAKNTWEHLKNIAKMVDGGTTSALRRDFPMGIAYCFCGKNVASLGWKRKQTNYSP